MAGITCKKDKEENWSQTLRGTAWAGEVIINASTPESHAMTVVFANDSNLVWFEKFVEYDGTWSVNKNIVTIKLPNKTVTAKLAKNSWSDISQTVPDGDIKSIERSSVPSGNLAGTEWTGKKLGTKDFVIKFKANSKLEITEMGNTYTPVTVDYYIFGAGILFGSPAPMALYGVSYYGAFFSDGKVFKGFGYDPYNTNSGSWVTNKK